MSDWCANYTLVDKNGNKTERRAMACFSEFYYQINLYKEVMIYVLEKYPYPYNAENASNLHYTDEEVREYARLLNEIGFNVHLDDELVDIELNKKSHKAYAFRIFPEENSILVNTFLLNLVRFLYESTGKNIVAEFLSLCKREGSTSIYNRLILAFSKENYTSGHCPLVDHQLLLLLNEEELQKQLLSKEMTRNNVTDSLPQTNKPFNYPYTGTRQLREEFFAEHWDKPIEELETKYKELCEKYMSSVPQQTTQIG